MLRMEKSLSKLEGNEKVCIRRVVFPSSKPFDGLTVGHIIGPCIWAFVFLLIILLGNQILNFNSANKIKSKLNINFLKIKIFFFFWLLMEKDHNHKIIASLDICLELSKRSLPGPARDSLRAFLSQQGHEFQTLI